MKDLFCHIIEIADYFYFVLIFKSTIYVESTKSKGGSLKTLRRQHTQKNTNYQERKIVHDPVLTNMRKKIL